MSYDYEIQLLKKTYSENAMGDPVKTVVERTVSADKLDYRNKDFYQAMSSGLKPSITFAINKYEYEDEGHLKFNGNEYKIIDVFPIKAKDESEFESIALICEGLVNNAGT